MTGYKKGGSRSISAMSSDLQVAFLQELEEVQFKVHKLEAMAISAGWRENITNALQKVSNKVKEVATGGPFDAMHISGWLHKTYVVDVNKENNKLTFTYKDQKYVINSEDGKNFTIQRGSETEKVFNTWEQLKIHMKSLTMSCSAASVDDVVRYSRMLMQTQASMQMARCGQSCPRF